MAAKIEQGQEIPESPIYIYYLAKNIATNQGFSWSNTSGVNYCFFGIQETAGGQELVAITYNYDSSRDPRQDEIKIIGPNGLIEITSKNGSYNSSKKLPNGLGIMLTSLQPDIKGMDDAVKALQKDSDNRGKTLVYSR